MLRNYIYAKNIVSTNVDGYLIKENTLIKQTIKTKRKHKILLIILAFCKND